MSKLKPVNDKIVVKPNEKPDDNITDSGIILPDTAAGGELSEGIVVSVGQGMYSTSGNLIPVAVKEGDNVLYNQHAMVQEYTLDGEKLIIMSQNEILSIVED